MSFALKYVWNMVNLFQFLIFVPAAWQLNYPRNAEIFLSSLKNLVLMEFLPTEKVTQAMSSMFGLTEDETSSEVDESSKSRRLSNEESESPQRSKSNSDIIKRLGVMLVIALTIAIFLFVFWLLKYLTHRDYQWYKRYMTLHDKIFYNLFIRYIFQSTLKIQFASYMTLMLLPDWKSVSNIVQGVVSYFLLIMMQACPFVFAAILFTKFTELNRYRC